LKNEVQLKGEEAIFRINENMNRVISKLDEYKIECKNGLKEPEYVGRVEILRLEKETGRRELEKWMTKLNEIKKKNDEEWKRIKNESEKAIEDFEIKLAEFKLDLFSEGFLNFRDEIEKDFGKFDPNFELG
jgi:hypothetical protein